MPGGPAFGTTTDGRPVERFAISGGALSASVMNWGAVVTDLHLDGHDAPLVLGFERFEDYLSHPMYLGAIVGRYANRIAGGRFSVDGERFQGDTNFLGRHLLHGGRDGFSERLWTISELGGDFVTLSLHDPAGAMGFPGALDVTCIYRIKPPATLSIELVASCDEPTLCNLAHHSYFNLDDGGAGTILDHRLTMPAGAYLPVDAELIPTGEVQPVEGTPFDFRLARPVRLGVAAQQVAYDHNFCLTAGRKDIGRAAWLQGGRSGVEMEVWTTEPGLQLYTGQYISTTAPGLGGRRYGAYSGLCLEPQVWPDSPNRAYFPQALLVPGDVYRQTTEYRFRRG